MGGVQREVWGEMKVKGCDNGVRRGRSSTRLQAGVRVQFWWYDDGALSKRSSVMKLVLGLVAKQRRKGAVNSEIAWSGVCWSWRMGVGEDGLKSGGSWFVI